MYRSIPLSLMTFLDQTKWAWARYFTNPKTKSSLPMRALAALIVDREPIKQDIQAISENYNRGATAKDIMAVWERGHAVSVSLFLKSRKNTDSKHYAAPAHVRPSMCGLRPKRPQSDVQGGATGREGKACCINQSGSEARLIRIPR